MKLHLENENGVQDTVVVERGAQVSVVGTDAGPRIQAHACGYPCPTDCTLVGHAYEAIRFLNQCLEHGVVDNAVEGDPNYNRFLLEVAKNQQLLLARIGQRARRI